MKVISISQILLASAALLAAAPASAALRPASTVAKKAAPELQVYVDVPIPWHPIRQWNLADNLAMLVADTMHQLGYQGRVVHLHSDAHADQSLPQLTLHLIVWRLDRTQNVECTFGATLRIAKERKDLGIFSGMRTVVMPNPDGWEISDTVQDAAKDAVNQLCRQVRKSGLLPGFTEKHSKRAA